MQITNVRIFLLRRTRSVPTLSRPYNRKQLPTIRCVAKFEQTLFCGMR